VLANFGSYFLNVDFERFSLVIKINRSTFKSIVFVGNWFSTRVFRVSISRKSGIIVVFSVKSECEKKEWTSGLLAFKIGFYFIFITNVKFFFFRVKKGEVDTVLSVLEAIVF